MAAQACVCVFCEFVSKFESKFALIENFCVFCVVCVRLKANIPEVSTGAASCLSVLSFRFAE